MAPSSDPVINTTIEVAKSVLGTISKDPTSLPEPKINSKIEQGNIPEHTTPRVEQGNAEHTRSSSTEYGAKQVEPTNPPLLPSNECPTPPLPTSDEGYGYGVSLDSMIVTPCVPILIEDTTNVGISEEPKGNNEESMPPMGFDPSALFRWARAYLICKQQNNRQLYFT